jgi:hypothetical protein
MKRSALLRLGVLACALAGLLATGCGTKKVKVHGKLTYGAKPVTGSEREPLVVTFCPYNGEGKADGQPCPAEVDQSAGTYEAVVPVGQHRICVSRFGGDLNDQFEGTFAQGQSPIVREVQDQTEINLDLQKLHREAKSGTMNIPMPR